MKQIGKGIALGALTIATAWLEINGKPCSGLWLLIVIIFLLGSWK